MYVDRPRLGAATAGPSQFFTLDAACYYGCMETGAGNCEEICQVPAFQTGTTAKASNLQWWILAGFAAVALLVVTSG